MSLLIVARVSLLLFLAAASLADIRYMKIPVILAAAGTITGSMIQVFFRSMSIWEISGGCLLGCLLLLTAYITREQIGYGDGLVFFSTGIFLGVFDNILLFLISLFLVFTVSVFMFFSGKRKVVKRLPFISFILIAYVVLLLF